MEGQGRGGEDEGEKARRVKEKKEKTKSSGRSVQNTRAKTTGRLMTRREGKR